MIALTQQKLDRIITSRVAPLRARIAELEAEVERLLRDTPTRPRGWTHDDFRSSPARRPTAHQTTHP